MGPAWLTMGRVPARMPPAPPDRPHGRHRPATGGPAPTHADLDQAADELVDAPAGAELPAAPTIGHAVRSAGWGVVDQGVYSLTNLVLTVLVATSVDAERFGAFAAVYATYLLVYGLVEGSVGNTFAVVYSGTPAARWRPALARAAGSAIVAGLVVGGASAAAGLLVGGPFGEAMVAFAAILPALLLQAVWRTAFFAVGEPRRAVVNDLLWAVSQLAALAVVLGLGHDEVAWLVAAWGAGAVVGALVGVVQLGVRPAPSGTVRWLREHRHLGLRFSGEFFVLYGSSQVVLLAIGPWAGLDEVGALRGAQVLFGPVQALLLSMRFALTPVFVRVRRSDPRRLVGAAVLASLALAGLALVWGLALLALPDAAGEALLGDSWAAARTVVPAMTFQVVALGTMFGPFTGLRAREDAAATLRIGTATAVGILVLGLLGADATGATGAQWGISAAVAVGATRLWYRFLRSA